MRSGKYGGGGGGGRVGGRVKNPACPLATTWDPAVRLRGCPGEREKELGVGLGWGEACHFAAACGLVENESKNGKGGKEIFNAQSTVHFISW